MAAIPLIERSTEVGGLPPAPHLDPGGYAALSTSGLRALAAAGSTIAGEAQQTYQTYAAAQKEIRNQQVTLETEQALGEFDRAAADAVFSVRADPSITPDQYASEVERRLRVAQSGIEKNIKTPDVLPRFQIGAQRHVNTQLTKAKYEGLEQQLALNNAAVSLLNDRDQNTAVFGVTPEERQAAIERITERTDRQLRTRGMSADQYKAELKRNFEAIEEGEVRRDFRDPTKRAQVIDGLATGRYTTMASAKQLQLAETLQNTLDAQFKRAAEESERVEKKNYTTLVDDLYTRASPMAGPDRLTPAQMEKELRDRGVTLRREDRAALEAQMTKDADEAPSDPIIRARVMSDVLSMNPRMSEQELMALNMQHRGTTRTINSRDYQTALTHRTSRLTALESKDESRQVRDYHQADQLLRTGLGIPDIIPDKIDPKRLLALEWARQELQNRSWPTNGQKPAQPPLEALKDILPRAKQLLGDNAVMEMGQIRTLLEGADPELAQMPDAAKMSLRMFEKKKAGVYSATQYETVRRLVVEFDRAWKIHFENEAARWAPIPPAPMAAPPSTPGRAPAPAAGRAPTATYTKPVP